MGGGLDGSQGGEKTQRSIYWRCEYSLAMCLHCHCTVRRADLFLKALDTARRFVCTVAFSAMAMGINWTQMSLKYRPLSREACHDTLYHLSQVRA